MYLIEITIKKITIRNGLCIFTSGAARNASPEAAGTEPEWPINPKKLSLLGARR
jgi:hypothetical protein